MQELRFDRLRIQSELREVPHTLLHFLRQPVKTIQNVPNWHWITLGMVQLGLAALTGALSGLAQMSILNFFLGLFLFPITAVLAAGLAALFFYYFFFFLLSRQLPIEKLLSVVVLANIPLLLFHTISEVFPPSDLFGYGLSALLLVVGLVDNFQLPRKPVIRMICVFYLVFFLVWGYDLFSRNRQSEILRKELAPQSLDHLERQLNQ